MSNLLIKLMSRSGLLKHAIAGVSLAASLAAHAATVDAAVSLSGNAAVQAENLMNAQVGFAPVPLSDAEADSVDAERLRWRRLLPQLPKFPHCLPIPGMTGGCICH